MRGDERGMMGDVFVFGQSTWNKKSVGAKTDEKAGHEHVFVRTASTCKRTVHNTEKG